MLSKWNVHKLIPVAGMILALSAANAAAGMGNAGEEIKTAAEHAGYAAKAPDVKGVQMHLHHAINCLVGPKGQDFDESYGNPCAGEGDGALNDFAGPPDKKAYLEQALSLASTGVTIQSHKAVKFVAEAVHALLMHARS